MAKYAARGKEYLVCVRPFEGGLVMQQMHYANEVRPFADIPLDDSVTVKDSELKLALQLIEQTASEAFEPAKYENLVTSRMKEIIETKIEGEEITVAPGEAPQAQVVDLMEALKASLAGDGAATKTAKKKTTKARKPAKASPRTAKKPAAKKRKAG